MKDLRFIYIKDNQNISNNVLQNKINEFNEVGEKFNSDYYLSQNDVNEYNKLKKQKNNSWSQFKEYFAFFSASRCPICEMIIDKYDDIEHYRPKEHYWWLAYDYKNYYAVCSTCNRNYKNTDFPLFEFNKKVDFNTKHNINQEQPLLYNPTTDNPLELFELEFVFESNNNFKFVIKPLKNLLENSYLYKKAETTIKIYNLNNTEKSENIQDFYTRQTLIKSLYNELYDFAKTKIEFEKMNKIDKTKVFREFVNLKQKYENCKHIGLSDLIKNGNITEIEKMKIII